MSPTRASPGKKRTKKSTRSTGAKEQPATTRAKKTTRSTGAKEQPAAARAKKTTRSTGAKEQPAATRAKKTTRSTGAKEQPAATRAKKTTRSTGAKEQPAAARTRSRSASVPAGDAAARVAAAVERIVDWLRRRAPAAIAGLRPPASDLGPVEAALGRPLPADLAALWRLHDGGLPIFEYAGLGCAEALRRRAGLEQLRAAGAFAGHEVFEQAAPRIQPTKWHPAWIPLAEDGCGNLYCVDLEPGPAGHVGQVIRWETRGGPFAAGSVSLAELLGRYARALAGGRFTYDPDSGTFDGPYLDLLAPR